MLAWRLLHDPRLAAVPGWLAPLLPHPAGDLDRDPVALLLGALACGFALLYVALSLFRARPLWRAAVIAAASLVLVVGPTAAFVAMGLAADRPYGQDGGVVQLPLAMDKILAGQAPYGADYSDSILGKQARVSSFWEPFGGNPILHHHAYLPGTHALMLPFYLVFRALFGLFDPRFVTLLAYALAALLATRLVADPAGRLCAAAVFTLNPLVYWHQIFGANDLMFVALLVGAAILAEKGRPTSSGALLGLACATKQLAWPFAPFLLLHLSGARSFRELAGRPALARVARPALAAAVVFVIVVLPVAALDFGAFWGDIVAYNVGLPGADNYPLGGTPGFGFANFLIYFGSVTSLRDYFPFSVFYLLLIPLGIALVRIQLREGGTATALLTGSAALLASLYFSRVVHANYLIPAATLLPLAVISGRRGADLAAVPLALLALGVEVVEGALLRTSWDQAVTVGLPARLTGLAKLLAPRAGPALTADPLGLALSATAAGLGVAYLAAGSLRASPRLRNGLIVVAGVLVVAVPTLVVASIGERTGTPRGQEAWIVQATADAARLARGESPYKEPLADRPLGREAWTTSFRLEPPRVLAPDRPLLPPGPSVLAALLRPLGLRDPRPMLLAALAVLALLLSRRLEADQRPIVLAVALAPPVALGLVFGSPASLPLAALAGALAFAAGGHALAAGLVAGLAGALDHRSWLVAPFLLLPLLRAQAVPWRRLLAGLVVGYGALVLPALAMDPGAFAVALTRLPEAVPGLGLVNLSIYWGGEGLSRALVVMSAPVVAALLLVVAWRFRHAPPVLLGAGAALLGLFLIPGAPVEAMAIPLALLVRASAREG